MTSLESSDQFRVQWLVLCPQIIFKFNDQFWVQWLVWSPVTNFESSDHFRVQWSVLNSKTNLESCDQFVVKLLVLSRWPVLMWMSLMNFFSRALINYFEILMNLWCYEMLLRLCCFMIRVNFMLRSWDSYSYEFLVSCLLEFKVLECLPMLIGLYVGSWV